MKRPPPRLFEWVAERVLPVGHREHLLGDLAEGYSARRGRGPLAAGGWYLGEVVAAFGVRLRGLRRGGRPVRDGLRNIRLTIRSLLHRPGFTLSSVLTLALAIGAAGAVYAVVDGILLRPLPYDGADRIVSFSELHPTRFQELGWSTVPNYLDITREARSFEATALFRGRSMSITGDAGAQYVYSAMVTDRFFKVFGARPWLGRTFDAAETRPGAAPVAIVSYEYWRRSLGADSSVVGSAIEANGVRYRVVGVMGPGFHAPSEWIDPGIRVDVWVPFAIDPEDQPRSSRSYNMVARLAPGVSLADARAETALIWGRLQASYPEADGEWTLRLMTWQGVVVGGAWRPIVLIGAVMALVLLVSLANASNLVLNRVVTRKNEYAIRSALGAGHWRLSRQAMGEALLVTGAAALLGCVLAAALLHLLQLYPPGGVPRLTEVTLDWRVIAAILLGSVLSGFIIGLAPAWHAARPTSDAALWRSARYAGAGHGTRRVRNTLAVGQLALALALFIGSLLVLRSFARLQRVDPGFDPRGVMTATVALSWNRVSEPEARDRFMEAVLVRLRALPAVERAASINSLPLSGSNMQNTFAIPGRTDNLDEEPYADIRGISTDYPATMGIPLRGRDFTTADLVRPPRVALVNQALGRRYFPGQDPIGHRLTLFGNQVITIVGVVGDVHHHGMDAPVRAEIYLPLTGDPLTSKTFVVRTAGDASTLAPALRRVIAEVDPDQPIRDLASMSEWVRGSMAARRFQTLLFGLLAGLAVVLSLVGLVAVVSYGVTERLPEIGVRMALGANRSSVVRWVVRWAWTLAAPAAVLGIVAALLAGNWLQSFLFEVSARDLAVFGLSLGAFAVLVTAVALVPALRATRVDPASVLKG